MEKKCKYCGKEIKGKHYIELGACATCVEKRPLVKELVALCQVIKKECVR
jgi:hypothetical protein